VENLAEDSGNDYFKRVLHNENHVLHPLLPERNDHGYELRRLRHERGLFLRPTMPNAILYTNNCISIGLATNFSTSLLLYRLIAFCQFIIPGRRMCYVV